MFGWFKREEVPEYEIEYYPKSGRYYPKCKGRNIHQHQITGVLKSRECVPFTMVVTCTSEDAARKVIELFKEQELKENVIKIKVE